MPIRYLPHTRFARANKKAGGGSSYSPEYNAVLGEYIVAPSDADAAAQNTFVEVGVDDDWWGDLDGLIVLASHASGADSLLNWIDPTGTGATLVNPGDLTWAQYQGYKSGGTNGYINFNKIPNSLTNYAQDDAFACSYRRALVDIGDDFGAVDSTPSRVLLYGNVGVDWGNINGDAFPDYGSTTRLPFRAVERDNSADFDARVNAVLTGNSPITDASTGAPAISVFGLCYNNGGAPASFCEDEISMFAIGKALGATKQLSFYNAFQALMTYYGTQV